ncbi:1,25-dihydroxyvitamin D(3) 24-hydroxylase, mitochondrial-like [Ambystoma mexicanum]|uniref:1,25-dihydroxyvitamin D(3) 24-hydroxylase, mitochondrial-like n=1 Tax=Ambystoma mexicanum TaxID=8296 RepID=UPI0037E7F82F
MFTLCHPAICWQNIKRADRVVQHHARSFSFFLEKQVPAAAAPFSPVRSLSACIHSQAFQHPQPSLDARPDALCPAQHLPFSSLPGPADWPGVGSLLNVLWHGGLKNQHEIMFQNHKKYGKIFRMNLGTFKSVQIGDPALVESFFRSESKYPKRLEIKPWKMYRDYRGEAYGLLTLEGQEWQTMRRAFQRKLMKPKEVAKLDVKINEVMADFVTSLGRACDENGCVDDIYFELNKWSYETICSVLYNIRCGLLHEQCGEEALLFIKSVKKMMQYLGPLMVTSASLHRKFNTAQWQQHTQAWDNIFSTARNCISKRLENQSSMLCEDILSAVCRDSQLTRKQLSGMFSELQIGGVETTANSLMWAIFNLSRNPDAQKKLYEEIQNTLQPGMLPSIETLHRMPFLKSCLKESMRLTPTIPFTSRTLEEDARVGGFLLPEGTVVMINFHAMTWNEEYFPDAKEFKPERWLKGQQALNPFANTPFGIGKRMCIGRRLAELQLHLALCWLVQHFQIEATDSLPVKALFSGVMIPNRNIPVSFKKR